MTEEISALQKGQFLLVRFLAQGQQTRWSQFKVYTVFRGTVSKQIEQSKVSESFGRFPNSSSVGTSGSLYTMEAWYCSLIDRR